MIEYLGLKKSNCKHCYKCIRNCPVKAISFSSNQANVIADECILCGRCFVACPQTAKIVRSDLERAKTILAQGGRVVASVAPSFVANYEGVGFEQLREKLLALGFSDAEETALGATIVKNKYDEMLASGEHKVLISSCCHSVNSLIRKYYPEALSFLAKVVSPMQAHCAAIKQKDPDAKTVFIGPCISKKEEAEQYPASVDCVLTFEELTQWMTQAGQIPQSGEGNSPGGKARLFPITGGILRSMRANEPGYSYLAVDGVENCIAAIRDILAGEITNCFVEMSACTGSCVGGPVMQHGPQPVKDYLAVSAHAGPQDFAVLMPDDDSLQKNISYLSVNRQKPGEGAIRKALGQIGKTLPEHELNCGSCGYETCREKAAAVLGGKADQSMCLPYLMGKAESFSDTIIKNTPNGIIVLSEALEIQQINAAARQIMNIREAGDVLNQQVVCVLDPLIFLEVLENGRNIYERKVFLAEYDRHVKQTVLLDKSYHIIICIMRDITENEVTRAEKSELSRKTIEITDKVIEKQMRAVQEIASLLGETTAETKIALTKLKETLRDE